MIKKENDELTQLFCTHHLGDAEITPRDGFWESIQNDVSLSEKRRRKLIFYRTVSAASVLLIIGAASAAFFFIPKSNNTNQIIAKVAASMSRVAPSKQKLEIEPKQTPSATQVRVSRMASSNRPTSTKEQQPEESDNDSTVTVTVHMTVRVRDNGTYADNTSDNRNNNTWQAGGLGNSTDNNTQTTDKLMAANNNSNKRWALKAALNLAMPASGEFEMPTGGSITLERQLNDWLAVESGIKYTYMHSDAQTLHYLSIPVKVNATLARLSKVDFYATVGGSADKCIAATHGSANENIQFTAMAGVGICYHLNSKIAFFAEPAITHYFNNESKYTSYRTEKSNAFSLQSGLCMNF